MASLPHEAGETNFFIDLTTFIDSHYESNYEHNSSSNDKFSIDEPTHNKRKT